MYRVLILTFLWSLTSCHLEEGEYGVSTSNATSAGTHFLLHVKPSPLNSVMPTSGLATPQLGSSSLDQSQESGFHVKLQSNSYIGQANDLYLSTSGGVLFDHSQQSKARIFQIGDSASSDYGKIYTTEKVISPSTFFEMNALLNISRLIVQHAVPANLSAADPQLLQPIDLFFKTYFETTLSNTSLIAPSVPSPSGASVSPNQSLLSGAALVEFIVFPNRFQKVSEFTYQHASHGNVTVNAWIEQFKTGINEALITQNEEPQAPLGDANPNQNPSPSPEGPQSGPQMDRSKVINVESEEQHKQLLTQAQSAGVNKILVIVGNPKGCRPCIELHGEVQKHLAGRDQNLYLEIDHKYVVQPSDDLSQKYNGFTAYPHVFILDAATGTKISDFRGAGQTADQLTARLNN